MKKICLGALIAALGLVWMGAVSAGNAVTPKSVMGTAKAKMLKKAAKPKAVQRQVVVYYLHGNARCGNCIRIEEYSKEAVMEGFSKELKNGTLQWLVLNTDEADNAHYMKDFQLFTKSLVIVEMEREKQKRFKNLQGVWNHLGDKEAFIKYVREEVDAYLKGK